jgi:hypothetical protein
MSERGEIDLATAKIIPLLPSYFHPESGQPIPGGLIGARIIRMGTVSLSDPPEGGGLVIDYQERGSKQTKRVVFAFNELGMWVKHEGFLAQRASPGESQE